MATADTPHSLPGPDATTSYQGGLYLVSPLTSPARDWLGSCHQGEGTWYAGSLVVEPRYLEPLIRGMRRGGLQVEEESWDVNTVLS